MAVTKIWAIKNSIKRVVDYAKNSEKTEYDPVKQVLHYAEDGRKVVAEKTIYVTGINCRRETAIEEMKAVQERFDKTSGNVAYHAYQSFRTGEVSPELCHKLGVELAKRMWGEEYQVLVATHFNTGTYHNHFVVNAVNLWNGKKFNCNQGAYWKLRSLSDALCREYGLSVIEHPKGKTPRSIYFAEKRGEATLFQCMREAIDEALAISLDMQDFVTIMGHKRYIIQYNPRHRNLTIRPVGSKKGVRTGRLGEKYDRLALEQRIRQRSFAERHHNNMLYREQRRQQQRKTGIRHSSMLGKRNKMKKITGFRALCLHYGYLMGFLPKRRVKRTPMSPMMQQEVRKLKQYTKKMQLIQKENLRTETQVAEFLERIQQEMREIEQLRKGVYHKLRRCPEEQTPELRKQRDEYTQKLQKLRQERSISKEILATIQKKKQLRQQELAMQREFYGKKKQKTKKRDYVR